MTSQLNPDAAVFVPVPVSPTRLLMMDEAIITASSGVTTFDEPIATIDFSSTGGPKHVDYFMRDNFSTIPNKIKELANATAASSITVDIPRNPQEHMEPITIDQLMGIQTIEKTDITDVLIDIESGDLNVSENNNNSTSNAIENMSKDILFPETTTSLKVEVSCFKITEENSLINMQPDLSKDGKLCQNSIMTIEDPQKVLTSQKKKSKSSRNRYRKKNRKNDPSIIENNEGFITEHRKTPPIDLTFKPLDTFSDANPFGALQTPTAPKPIDQDQCYNLAELYQSPQEAPKRGETMNKPEITQLDIATNIPSSFILRRSPVDDNVVPFEELESPKELPRFVHPPNANRVVTATELPESLTLVDGIETLSPNEVKTNTEKKESVAEAKQDLPTNVANAERQKSNFTSVNSKVNKLLDTTQRFLRPEYTIAQPKKEGEETLKLDSSPRPSNKTVMPDNKLNSEGEISPVVIDIEPEVLGGFDIIPTSSSESADPKTDLDHITNVEEIISELNDGDINVEMQETSFTDKNTQENVELMNSILKQVEANILQDNEKFNEAEKTNDSQTETDLNINDISSATILTALDIVRKTYNNIECNIKGETKEMSLDLEGNTTTSQSTPEELRNLVQGFEVINKDELVRENYLSVENTADISEAGLQKGMEKEKIIDSDSPQEATLSSLLGIDYDFPIDEVTTSDKNVSADVDNSLNNTFQKSIDKVANAEDDKLVALEHSASAEEVQVADTVFHEEKEYNPSIPEDTALEAIDFLEKPDPVENLGSIEKEEFPIHPDVEYAQSDMSQTMNETEAHTGSLEEVNRLPIIEMSEVELIAGTINTTSISSELEGKHLQSLPTTMATETETEKQVRVAFRCISPRTVIAEEIMEEKEVPVDNISSDPPSKQPAGPAATSSAAKSVPAKTTTSVLKTTSGVKQTTPSGKTSSVKPTASTISTTKTSASGSSSAKPTATSSATSKPGVVAAKPSATASSKPVPSSTAPSKPNAQSAATSKSTTSGAVTSKSSTSNVTPSKSASGVAPPKPSVTSVTSKASTSTAVSSKTSNTGTTSAKPAVTSGATSKTATSSAASSKPTNVSKPAAVSSTLPGTSSPKPTSSSSTTAKPTVTTTTAKKPAATSTVKPTGIKTTTPSSKPSVVSSTSSTKPVPKPLQISETTLGQKSPSKPSTPTSNPTTPTTPRSPVLKSVPSVVKSPPKPESKSSSVKTSTSSKPVADKKPTTNSEAKPVIKKVEAPKSSTTVASKPSAAPAKPAAPVTKVASSATKSQTPTAAKTAVTKPVAVATKQKPDETSVGVKKSVAATVAKNSEKNSKELVGGKPTNGKTLPTKTSNNSKTDTKVNTKNGEKPVPKKAEEVKKEEKCAQLQEQKVSTTNEITNYTSDKHDVSQPMTNMVAEAVN